MLKWDQSNPKSLSAPAVLEPNCRGSGYRVSLPRKVDKPISQRKGQSRMHMGHIPLVGLRSFTRVIVPVVDLLFRYEEFLETRSGISLHLYVCKPVYVGYRN